MPYVDQARAAARHSRRTEGWKSDRLDLFPRPEGARLIGRAFQSAIKTWGAAPDFGVAPQGALISRELLRALLEATFAGKLTSECALRPVDRFDDWAYYAPTLAEVDRVVASRSAKGKAYETEIFDCEDFAYSLRADFARNRYETEAKDAAFAAGLIWGEGTSGRPHVANVVAVPAPPGGAAEFAVKIVDTLPENFSATLPHLWLSEASAWSAVDYLVI